MLTVKQAAAILNLKPASMPYHDAALRPVRTPGGARRYDPERVQRYARQGGKRHSFRFKTVDEAVREALAKCDEAHARQRFRSR